MYLSNGLLNAVEIFTRQKGFKSLDYVLNDSEVPHICETASTPLNLQFSIKTEKFEG